MWLVKILVDCVILREIVLVVNWENILILQRNYVNYVILNAKFVTKTIEISVYLAISKQLEEILIAKIAPVKKGTMKTKKKTV